MEIGGLQKLTLIDFPGRIACTVFLQGCNYRCPFCHNPELVIPEIIKEHLPIPEKDFFQFLKERKQWLEGVCIGGGEPTILQDLPEFCQKIKKLGYQIKIDTNGSNPDMLKNLIEKKLIDYVAMDIKAPKEKYPKVIGFKDCSKYYLLNKIENSINILKENNLDYEFRTTVIPKLLTKNDILKIARWIAPCKKYVLQNFQSGKTIDSKFEKIKPYPEEFLFSLRETISPFFDICEVR